MFFSWEGDRRREVMAAYGRDDSKSLPAGRLSVHRDQLRAQLVWENFNFTLHE